MSRVRDALRVAETYPPVRPAATGPLTTSTVRLERHEIDDFMNSYELRAVPESDLRSSRSHTAGLLSRMRGWLGMSDDVVVNN